MFRFRRVVTAALEDFGLRRRPQVAPPSVPIEVPPVLLEVRPQPASPRELTPGIVWQGRAIRRPELQRFCDHLDSLRERVS